MFYVIMSIVLIVLVALVAVDGLSVQYNGVGMFTRHTPLSVRRDRFVGVWQGERARTHACAR